MTIGAVLARFAGPLNPRTGVALVGKPCAERSGKHPGVRQITGHFRTGGSLSRQNPYTDAAGSAPQFCVQRGEVCAQAQGLRQQRGFTPGAGDSLIVNANG